jgi:hypothetical protein
MPQTEPQKSVSDQEQVQKHYVNVEEISSPALARLIEEVRNQEVSDSTAYNRFHNRHNR